MSGPRLLSQQRTRDILAAIEETGPVTLRDAFSALGLNHPQQFGTHLRALTEHGYIEEVGKIYDISTHRPHKLFVARRGVDELPPVTFAGLPIGRKPGDAARARTHILTLLFAICWLHAQSSPLRERSKTSSPRPGRRSSAIAARLNDVPAPEPKTSTKDKAQNRQDLRRRLAAGVEAYLAGGNSIEQLAGPPERPPVSSPVGGGKGWRGAFQ